MNTLWTIITLTIRGRERSLDYLKTKVGCLIDGLPIEHLIFPGPEKYGIKMRKSSEKAKGEYISYIDDDDDVEDNYVKEIYNAIQNTSPEVVTFGSYTPKCVPAWLRTGVDDNSGIDPIDNGNIKTANHYCAWRKDIAMSSVWLPRNYAAEVVWYNILKYAYPDIKETHIHKCLHIYNYNARGTRCQDWKSITESLANGNNRTLCFRHKDGRLLAGPSTDRLYQPDGKIVSESLEDLTLLKELNVK